MKNKIIRFLTVSGIVLFFPFCMNAQVAEYNYATGNVTGRSHVGGLIGRIADKEGKVTNSFARGSVTAEKIAGGFAGSNAGTIENSYSTGKITGNSDKGGFAGSAEGTATNSYWDTQTSTVSVSAGGSGRTTANMTYPYATGTFTGWDFNSIWKADISPVQNNGYPLLLASEVFRLDLRVVPAGSGTVSGAGYYKANQQAQLNAIANQSFTFKGWAKNSEIISTGLQYIVTVSDQTTLEAHFEKTTTGTENLSLVARHFVVYPNPVKDVLRVDASGLSENVRSFYIINLIGQVVKSSETDNISGNRTSFLISDLKSGMYFMKANLEKDFVLEKFIKK